MTKIFNYVFRLNNNIFPPRHAGTLSIKNDFCALSRIRLFLEVENMRKNQLLICINEVGE